MLKKVKFGLLLATSALPMLRYHSYQEGLIFRRMTAEHTDDATLAQRVKALAKDNKELCTYYTKRGLKLRGIFNKEDRTKHIGLFFHGTRGSIWTAIDETLYQNTFVASYPGYQENQGTIKEEADFYEAIDAAFQFLTQERGYKAHNIVVIGFSLGSSAAVYLASTYNVKALIVRGGISNLKNFFPKLKPFAWILSRYELDNLERIKSVRAPIYIAHSPEDEVLSYEHHGLLLKQAAESTGNPVTFCTISGHHTKPISKRERQELKRFLQKIGVPTLIPKHVKSL